MNGTQKLELQPIKEILTGWVPSRADEERREVAAEAEERKAEIKKIEAQQAPRSADALVIDDRIGKIEYKLAKCCNPIKGDPIFGFVTISSGITVHRADCPNAQRLRERYPYRVMEARWRSDAEGAFRATIAIVAQDVSGLANMITETVSRELRLNIRSMNFVAHGDGTARGTVSVEVPGTNMVDTLIHSIMKIKGVQKAYRVNN